MDKYINAKVFSKEIEGEISKPTNYQCFNGAWYYKALSSRDNWLGIEAVVTLPEFIPDEERFDIIKDNIYNKDLKRFKDTPSVYVGISSDFENDIGFGWFRGVVDGIVKDEKITFRPFWRYIYLEDGIEKNVYKGTDLYATEYYYFPGDKLKVSVFCTKPNYVKFRIELLRETQNKKYQKIRSGLKRYTKTLETEEFPAPGVGIRPAEVKRVNAIDQYGNEGRPTQLTNALVKEATWEEVYLFRKINGEIVKVPFTEDRYIRMLCPNENAFTYNSNNNKETIIINPGKK